MTIVCSWPRQRLPFVLSVVFAFLSLLIGLCVRPSIAATPEEAIKRIQAGRYTPMPPPSTAPASGPAGKGMTIENGTGHTLHVHFSGPLSRSVVVPDGSSESIELAVGDYQVAAEVPGSAIIPFYGRQAYQPLTHYWLKFYTQRVQLSPQAPPRSEPKPEPKPTAASAQSRQRQGTFRVSGRLLTEDRRPAQDMEVVAAVVDDDGKTKLTIRPTPDGRWTVWAGSGKTDTDGRFKILVDRNHFEGSKMRFSILARPVGSSQNHAPATTPIGAEAVFVVGEADTEVPDIPDIVLRR